MNRSLAVWIGTLLVFVTSTAAVGVIIDDFDGGGAFISRVINRQFELGLGRYV